MSARTATHVTPAMRAAASSLRPLATCKPEILNDAVWTAINQVYGASRFAREIDDKQSAQLLDQLHTELTECVGRPYDQRSYVDALLGRWK